LWAAIPEGNKFARGLARLRAADARAVWARAVQSGAIAVRDRLLLCGQRAGEFLTRHYLWLFLAVLIVVFFALGLQRIIFDIIVALGSFSVANDPKLEGLLNRLLVLAAILGPLFFVLRTWIAERRIRTSEPGRLTERLAKAVELLGTDKRVRALDGVEVTAPNLEVRLGAIYALERISQDSPRDHWQVMEILSAYMRENACTWLNGAPPMDESGTIDLNADDFDGWLKQQPVLRADLQAILTVIARRGRRRVAESSAGQRIDLRGVILVKPDYIAAGFEQDLQQINLANATILGANLENANLRGANLRGADLDGANLKGANLEGANLRMAKLWEADLRGANLEGANLWMAQLWGADLRMANLEGAHLGMAHLDGANFRGANLEGVDLPPGWSEE